MKAEVISIGTELLLGEIVDTNAQYIAQQLRNIGLNLFYRTTVGDNLDRIAQVIDNSLNRVDVVITSGGLGPTVDDVTREGIALATQQPLEFRPDMLTWIENRFQQYGVEMSSNNLRQAYAPQGALAIENPVGTAPVFILETNRGIVIPLPGVPREMIYLMDNAVIPWLLDHIDESATIKARLLRVAGVGEGKIDMLLDDLMRMSNPTVGLAAHSGIVDVRITAKATTEAEALKMLEPVEAEVRRRLGTSIFGTDEELLEDSILKIMQDRGITLAMITDGLDLQPGQGLAKWVEDAQGCISHLSYSDYQSAENDAARIATSLQEKTGKSFGLVLLVREDASWGKVAVIAIANSQGDIVFSTEMRWLEQRGDISTRVMIQALAALRSLILDGEIDQSSQNGTTIC